ncbi:unnamed protein product [Ixodes pacificus]
MSTPMPSSMARDDRVSAMAMTPIRVSGGNKTDILLKTLQRFLWCLAVSLPVPSLVFHLTSALLCWGKDRDQVAVLDNLMTMVREVVAIVSGAIYCFTPPSDLERPVRDSFSRRLRVFCYLELPAYALLYIPHLFVTLLWNNSEAIMTMLFLCVDVEHLDHGTLSKVIFVGDYIGFMVANTLISWVALQYALDLAALRVELLSQPRCSLTSMIRRRRRLARRFAFPLLLWGCNTAVGFTVALRQSMHSINITQDLSALLLYSLFQMVHSVWTLALVAWAAEAFEGSLTNAVRARIPAGGGHDMAPLLRDYSDALGFFKPDGRCLVRLLAASLGYGVVLYQLTVPYVASTRSQRNSTEHASFGPRYS